MADDQEATETLEHQRAALASLAGRLEEESRVRFESARARLEERRAALQLRAQERRQRVQQVHERRLDRIRSHKSDDAPSDSAGGAGHFAPR